jgi:2-polyprenyl-6-methoxyphenol hydroxylase-like FAD-dependent oxidoreductase
LWFRIGKGDITVEPVLGHIARGRFMVTIDRGDYWQCAYVIPKGRAAGVRARGLDAFRAQIARNLPVDRDRLAEIASWDDVKLLTVKVDRLERWWRPGLLCIGDAAHAMSPVGGVGINLAIQDAVAAANLLAAPLRERRVTPEDLERVQRRREFPTRATQAVQLAVQRRVIGPVLSATGPLRLPFVARLLAAIPFLRRIPARLVGVGVRPEHVRTPS